MRIDRFITVTAMGSRKEAHQWLKQGRLTVNGQSVKLAKQQVEPGQDSIALDGEVINYAPLSYYLLNKPAGVLSATKDSRTKTVMALLSTADFRADLFPVGRLDKDTTGLLLLTNDGQLAHQLLSPKKQVTKLYQAQIDGLVTAADVARFAEGVITQHGTKFKPAKLQIMGLDLTKKQSVIQVQVLEGQFHEVKRLFQSIEKPVLKLRRLAMGPLTLPEGLPVGQYRPLTTMELTALKNSSKGV
ncbi:pseudouridine synthase [Loigolactobacillus backii]|uniref:Pseudouridine synthase n=1 Tax=Loigolactobacillus backii TaxID=375175 RepID=A0A192H2U4_9LACO|nr:pseudouridine synthase [Loigolactobacillus backii]ANK59272.1 16S rRNA pseudouridine(516) synthase [Loigolactobacillus backii]ANK62685.1 16S rRNA pseudouridine(516) synthase [Loigolactobacillus backii]ANK64264.1 16S rRNA pseudouridine(516) synthase [Loigolactobacillus backii]ANK67342.1 16S rRNA pseudouridine(516) synthase [Loigolactobacillus backii]ANK70307.1 16S rRNA pseudouridine(516) synthase [Loigolactobacillus backii]